MRLQQILEMSRQKGPSLFDQGKRDMIIMYRAVTASVQTFHAMDYVTLSRKFAIEHADHTAAVEDEVAHVLRAMVHPKNVYDAYNPGEYFYDGPEIPGRVIYIANP